MPANDRLSSATTALPVQQVYRYPFASHLAAEAGAQTLRLATFTRDGIVAPYFFHGRLMNPRRTAEQLRSLMHVVRARFHVPAAMLERILLESDPVVTSNDDRLRFEGFSACCGAYVRVDLLADALDGETLGRGTTNVDFNQPMLSALARVRSGDRVSVSVGADRVVMTRDEGQIVEKLQPRLLQASELHGHVVLQAFEKALRGDPGMLPRGLRDILEMMLETAARSNADIRDPEARTFLQAFKGSSKPAKAARALLALGATGDSQAALEQAIDHRLKRLKVWADR